MYQGIISRPFLPVVVEISEMYAGLLPGTLLQSVCIKRSPYLFVFFNDVNATGHSGIIYVFQDLRQVPFLFRQDTVRSVRQVPHLVCLVTASYMHG